MNLKNIFKRKEKIEKEKTEIVSLYDFVQIADGEFCSNDCEACSSILDANKYYNREEIQNISEVFGIDVFEKGFDINCKYRFKPIVLKR